MMKDEKPYTAMGSLLRMNCPNCRRGKMFTHPNPFNMKKIGDMPEKCPVCDQPFRLEPGFYFGAAYVSYALMVGWNIGMVLLTILIFGDIFNHFPEFMTLAIVTSVLVSPFMFRYSRVIYLYFFVRFRKGTVVKN